MDTHNQVFPLRDTEGPVHHNSDNYDNRDHEYFRSSRDYPNRSNGRNQDSHPWGFPRPNQGVKRPVENKEEQEGGGEQDPKKKRV